VRVVLPASTCARIPRLSSFCDTRHTHRIGQKSHFDGHERCAHLPSLVERRRRVAGANHNDRPSALPYAGASSHSNERGPSAAPPSARSARSPAAPKRNGRTRPVEGDTWESLKRIHENAIATAPTSTVSAGWRARVERRTFSFLQRANGPPKRAVQVEAGFPAPVSHTLSQA
jgi:hypothetical protein